MSGLLGGLGDWAKDVIDALSYVGLALLIALENVFPPIPSELILPLAGSLVEEGRMWFPGALLAATIGAVAGALILYGAGYWFGDERVRRLVRRYGNWFGVKEADLDKANGWFDRHGGIAVLICRLLPVVRSIISIPAGIRRMPLVPFIAYTAIGSGLWNAVLIGLGWWLGDRWEEVEGYADYLKYAVLAVGAAAVAWFIWKRKFATKQPAT